MSSALALCSPVAPALEELQLDGSIYERGGRFFAL